MVPPPGRERGAGLRGALRGPARLLRQAHQERPAGLGAVGPAAAAAPRRAAPRAWSGSRRCAAAGDQAALHAGQAPHHQPGPARRAAGDPRPGLACRVLRRPGEQDPAAVPRRRLRRPAHRPSSRPSPAGPVPLPALPRRVGRAMADELLAAAAASHALWARNWTSPTSPRTSPSKPASRWRSPTRSKTRRTHRRPGRANATQTGSSPPHPASAPITGAVILGRLGDPSRFQSLAAARAFSGLVPSLDASGVSGRHGGPTKRGDALLREALFIGRRPGPPPRPHPGREVSPADGRGRQAPQLRALPHRHHPAHPHRRLLANQTRPTSSATSTAARHRSQARAIITERYTVPARHPHDAAPPRPERAGEARSRNALHRPARPTPTLSDPEPPAPLTSLRNSTASVLHRAAHARRTERAGTRLCPARHRAEERPTQPPARPREDRTLPPDPETLADRPTPAHHPRRAPSPARRVPRALQPAPPPPRPRPRHPRPTPTAPPQSRSPPAARTPGHYRLRYDRLDPAGKMSFRRAGRMHHLGIGKTHRPQTRPRDRRRHPRHRQRPHHRRSPLPPPHPADKHYWRNQNKEPGRWPSSRNVTYDATHLRPMSRLITWWQVRDSNPRMLSSLIYSQIPLAAWVTRQVRTHPAFSVDQRRDVLILPVWPAPRIEIGSDPAAVSGAGTTRSFQSSSSRERRKPQQRTLEPTGRRGDLHGRVPAARPCRLPSTGSSLTSVATVDEDGIPRPHRVDDRRGRDRDRLASPSGSPASIPAPPAPRVTSTAAAPAATSRVAQFVQRLPVEQCRVVVADLHEIRVSGDLLEPAHELGPVRIIPERGFGSMATSRPAPRAPGRIPRSAPLCRTGSS